MSISTKQILDVRSRSARAARYYDEMEQAFQKNLSRINQQEDFIEWCIANLPKVPQLISNEESGDEELPRLTFKYKYGWHYLWSDGGIDILFHNITYDEMVEEYAGPIYREFNCLWDLYVPSTTMIYLSSNVQIHTYTDPIKIELDCILTNDEQCVIIKEESHYTHQSTGYNYRIKCS